MNRALALSLVFALSACSSTDTKSLLVLMQQNCHTKGHVEGSASVTAVQGSDSFDFECWPTGPVKTQTVP